MNIKFKKTILILFISTLSVGCKDTKDDKVNVKDLIAEKKSLGSSIATEIPKLKVYKYAKYVSFEKKSPFEKYLDETITKRRGVSIKPNFDREQEYLEQYNISELTLTGVMDNNGSVAAVVFNGKSNYIVKVGAYIGKNFGEIIKIDKKSIFISEIVKEDGINNWVKKDVEIKMVSPYQKAALD
jgi:type IV pilus assembly protein PilP